MKLNDLPSTDPMPLQMDDESLLHAPPTSATVMMVDDEPMMTELIQLHLEERGYRDFIVVNEPHNAMTVLRTRLPDVLLLDLNMPGLNGFEVLAAVRSDPQVRYTPVIVLTASTQPDAKLRALALGATDFLAKPVDPSELVLRVRNVLAVRALFERTVNYDPATGLPNRRSLERRLQRLLERERDTGHCLLNVTIAECRHIRDTLGSGAADQVLRAIGERLTHAARSGEMPADGALEAAGSADVMRMDSDAFALLLPRRGDADAVARLATRVLNDMRPAVNVQGHEFALTTHIGIALAPIDGRDTDTLIKAADHARTQAQARGHAGYEFFSAELNARHHEHLTLGTQLRRAAERGELRLHYQPKVDIARGEITGAEALLRWQHPEHGLMPPGRFIPLAEEFGLIVDIGGWVIRQACADAARWTREGRQPLRVAVNVSQLQFENGTLVGVLRDALAESGLAPDRLVVELTESMLMGDAQAALEQMRAIKALGASLSIDDFGTGYSSLSYLKRMPVDELKVDRSFVMDLPGGPQDRAIVGTVITLGHSLGMTVVAEGVETPDQLRAVQALGCDTCQGFLFSKPLPEANFLALLDGAA